MKAIKDVYTILTTHEKLNNFIKLVSHISQKFQHLNPQLFSQTKQFAFIEMQFKKLQFPGLKEAFFNLPQLPEISAIILKTSKLMTLAFIMMPQKRVFHWHDHQGINGLTKVVCGQIQIIAIKSKQLQILNHEENLYCIQKNKTRKQILNGEQSKISPITPGQYNIHKIRTISGQGGFIDLLIPQYPDHQCNYFEQVNLQNDSETITLKKYENKTQQIIGLEQLVQSFKTK